MLVIFCEEFRLILTCIDLKGMHIYFQQSGNTLPEGHDGINIFCISKNITVLRHVYYSDAIGMKY